MSDWHIPGRSRVAHQQTRLSAAAVEALESRRLFCGAHGVGQVDLGTYPAVPTGPLLGGTSTSSGTTSTASSPLTALPLLSSLPSASKRVYLDFVGAAATNWGSYSVPATPAYSTDSDTTTFSTSELASIQAIWSRVSEKYSPFNVNVTTVDPGTYTAGQTLRVVVGGNGAWLGQSAGGVAYVNSFTSVPSARNTVWVFPNNLGNGDDKYTAEASAHESGHGFGLQHQSTYSGTTKTNEYNPGNSAVAPTMGNSYYAARGLWWYGTNSVSSTTYQDDMAVVSRSTNGFGYRADDVGGSLTTASPLTIGGASVSGSGVITQTSDVDVFSFSSGGGAISLSGNVAGTGATLDLKLSLYSSNGNVLASADTSSLGETLNATLPSGGTYYVAVASHGSYGDVGQYTISGTVVTDPNAVAAPSNLAATTSGTTATLTWTDNSTNETGVTLSRSTDASFATHADVLLPANTTSYTDATGLANGVTYYYRVSASNDTSTSGYSNTATATIVPTAPATLSATAASAGQINLAWSDVTGETGYQVQQSLDGLGAWTSIGGTLPANVTSYAATSLAQNTTYFFRVYATNAGGSSLASPIASATTLPLPIAPATPTNLSAVAGSAAQVNLSWSDNSQNEDGFYVERSNNGGKSYSLIAQIGANGPSVASYVDATVSKRKTYQYRVRAFNAGGNSAYSNVATVTTSSAGDVVSSAAAGAGGPRKDDDAWNVLVL